MRQNLTISNNVINAVQMNEGFEGISIGLFSNATIVGNTVTGVGDDPIAVHSCSNVKVLRNVVASVDGKIFVSNSDHIDVAYNTSSRMASPVDNTFYLGIGLLYVGFEGKAMGTGAPSSQYPAPDYIDFHDNVLRYPAGAIDQGGAIYVYGARHTTVTRNVIVHDSTATTGTLAAIWVLPPNFTNPNAPGWWVDPVIDPDVGVADTTATVSGIPKVHQVTLDANISTGSIPLSLISTAGNCNQIVGPLNVTNNIATPAGTSVHNAIGYQFNCTATSHGSGNLSHAVSTVSNF